MNTLVLKCQEVVNDDTLRTMNELRVKLIRKTEAVDATAKSYFGKVRSVNNGTPVNYKAISGNIKLFNSQADSVEKTDIDVGGVASSPYVLLNGNSGEISITNFQLVADMLGEDGNNEFFHGATNNKIYAQIHTEELKDLSISSIVGDIALYGNLSDLPSNLQELQAGYLPEGELIGDLSHLNNLHEITLFNTVGSRVEARQYNKVKWSFDVLASMPVTYFNMRGGICQGGDLYQFFKMKDSFQMLSLGLLGEPYTCSYVSGTSDIPTIDISAGFGINDLNPTTVETMRAFLTMLKDGRNADKITLPATINLTAAYEVRIDSQVLSLQADLSNLGCTISIGSPL